MFIRIAVIALLVLGGLTSTAQDQKFQLSSHILDISQGKPAPNVKIVLEKQNQKGEWSLVSEKITDKDGRVKDFLPYSNKKNSGIYRLTYFTNTYFKNLNQKTFYPFIEVVFEINDETHFHVPITLSPFGYSTYRGS